MGEGCEDWCVIVVFKLSTQEDEKSGCLKHGKREGDTEGEKGEQKEGAIRMRNEGER